jgi:hypothetical protein
MCFSPEASFAVGGALVPAGAYCVRTAWEKNPRLVPVALIPLAFAAQQVAEGFVWIGLRDGDPARVRSAALVFLFFALAFWPFWFAFLNAVLESRPAHRWRFAALALVTTAWFWAFYLPLARGPESLLTVRVVHHSIAYSYPALAVYDYAPRPVLRALYVLSILVPLLTGPRLFGWQPGAVLLASLHAAAALYDYAFVSVWCFFAAVLTGHLCLLFHRLPAPARAPAAALQPEPSP